MSIRFSCPGCGHPFDVGDGLAGKHARCKHCGHVMDVPVPHHEPAHASGHEPAAEGAGLRLRPAEEEPPRLEGHLLHSPDVPLLLRESAPEPRVVPEAVSDPDEPPPEGRAKKDPYTVLDPEGFERRHWGRTGPPPFWRVAPLQLARFLSGRLRSLRDWLYLVSILAMAAAAAGFLAKNSHLLNAGVFIVVAANVGMLVVGVAYLVSLPFKEGPTYGLLNLLVPFYAVYYWVTRWHKMRKPVLKTLGAFVPIALVLVAYFLYEEGPTIEKEFEQAVPPGVKQEIEQFLGGEAKEAAKAGKGDEPAGGRVQEAVDQVRQMGEMYRELSQPGGPP